MNPDVNLLREMIGYGNQPLMELEVGGSPRGALREERRAAGPAQRLVNGPALALLEPGNNRHIERQSSHQLAKHGGLIDPSLLEIMETATSKLHHALGHDLQQRIDCAGLDRETLFKTDEDSWG
jgi:hypothetical protein